MVIKYKITDYYTTSNKQKDVYVELVAKGAGFTNSFGFYDKGTKKYVTLIDNINGYANVDNTVAHSSLDKSVMVTFYGEIEPFLHNGTHHVMGTTINTNTYPWMLDMPLTGGFKWCAETHSIETVYPKYMDWRAGKVADGVWYTQYDSELVYKNAGK